MKKETMIAAIRQVLDSNMQNKHMHAFSESARLNEDLYLDSVLVLQLILHLELDLGLSVPEQNITAADYATVSSLADFLCQIGSARPKVAVPQEEEFEDVKVHCFVSCVCESLKRKGIDHRPFYFGVWDATFSISENFKLHYHSDDVDH
ncbi:phosphopantetheine-binding protein, partial [Enterovibrio nigricans]